MADTLVFTYNSPDSDSGESRKSPRVSEIWQVTSAGASAGDASTLTASAIQNIQAVIGPVIVDSGLGTNAVVVKTVYAISSSESAFVEVIGYP